MYSLDFAAQVSRICMDEIRRRGLRERKILRKSVPNSVLLLKVFRKQNCTADDLTHVSIHSVATLMQDTLWCCQERIVPKKVWRVINYETCTLDDLSRFISKRGQNLLVEILDFLVQVMRYKDDNQMDAYHLGEAMGKVTLGPPDCDPIIAEKAGHFLTRMIIEHSKTIHGEKKRLLFRVDSGFAWPSSAAITAKRLPMSKSEAARAKAKSYNRLITKIHKRNYDWVSNANVALYAMLENDYEPEPADSFAEPYLSIFSKHLDPSHAIQSPVLFRLVTEASKAIEPIPEDPFADSYLFGGGRKSIHHKARPIEAQISVAFDDFMPLLRNNIASNYYDGHTATQIHHTEKGNHGAAAANSKSHMKIINSSLSHMKLNLRKPKSQGMHHNQHDYIPEESSQQHPYPHEPVHPMPPLPASATNTSSTIMDNSSDTYTHSNKTLYSAEDYNSSSSNNNHPLNKGKQNQVKSMMKRVIKMGTIVPIKKTSQTSIY